ncbi:DUF2256 domain-containing protein [Primorskyibacter sp. 2E233]|uniref:DUF2256 domain-containing protein n=1 Tax=Primorskyibacter sp. 2E233 TaxID=3413431 RepID=UPI003BF2DB14
MAKARKKADLPGKPCATCGRPFAWRRKWAKVWDEVRYCSDRCRRERSMSAKGATAPKKA